MVVGIKAGESAAFAEVYDLTADRLYRVAVRMLHDSGAAEDAVQQAFLELVGSAAKLRGDGRSLSAWLYRSARFSALDELRRQKRRPVDPVENLPDRRVVEEPATHIDEGLHAALGELNERQRTALHLKYVDGLDGHAIAKILGSNRTAVYAMIARAEARLKKRLVPVESVGAVASLRAGG